MKAQAGKTGKGGPGGSRGPNAWAKANLSPSAYQRWIKTSSPASKAAKNAGAEGPKKSAPVRKRGK